MNGVTPFNRPSDAFWGGGVFGEQSNENGACVPLRGVIRATHNGRTLLLFAFLGLEQSLSPGACQ